MADTAPSPDAPAEEVVGSPNATENSQSCSAAEESPLKAPTADMPREDLIATAVNFLENPRVQGSPLSQKRAFLLKKGLTAEEIDTAIERSKVISSSANNLQLLPHPVSAPPLPPPPPPQLLQPEYSFWSQVSHFSSSVVIIGVACYGAYYVYKRYVEPYLRGWDSPKSRPDRLSQVQEQITALTEAIQQLREAVASLELVVAEDRRLPKSTEAADSVKQDSAISELKSEVLSVKALLLSRSQFPNAPKVTPPASSIPAWQLSSNGTSKKENGSTAEPGDSADEEDRDARSVKEAIEPRNGEVLQNRATGLA